MLLLDKLNERTLKDFQTEMKILSGMHSKHVIRFHGTSARIGHPAIVMEFMEGGSLHDLLMSAHQIPWEKRLTIGTRSALLLICHPTSHFRLLKRRRSPEALVTSTAFILLSCIAT
jgi:serine/threonine protein kinase